MKRTILIFMVVAAIVMAAVGVGFADAPPAKSPDSLRQLAPQREVNADWMVHPPVIDGDLNDWNNIPKMYLNGQNADYPAGSELFPPEDISAWASVVWTSQRVYLAIRVTDDYVVDHSRNWRQNDLAGFVFDVDNSGDFSLGDVSLTFASNNMLAANDGWPAGYEWAVKMTENGWQGEISFPNSELGDLDFLGGHQIGFTWGMQDNDGIGVESWMSWAGPDFLKPTTEEGLLTFANGPVRKWVAFRPGVDGYDGIIDSSLDSWHPDERHGEEQELVLYGRNYYHLVMKFDIPDLGEDVQVIDARVHINFTYSNHPDWSSYVRVYRLLRPWDEATVTWYNVDASTRWGSPGANAIGTDRENRRIATKTLTGVPGWVTFDLADDVARDMYENPENNFGIIFRAEEGANVKYKLPSSEAGPENAPWIEVYAEFPPDQGN